MKNKFLLTLVSCLFILTLSAQTTDTVKQVTIMPPPSDDVVVEKDNDGEMRIFTKVEQEATFPGGNKAWVAFLTAKLGGFDAARNGAPKGRYTVIARFVVSKSGKLSDISTETIHGYGMEKAVIKMIQQSPNWVPAMQNGRTVNAYRRQPVTFVVE